MSKQIIRSTSTVPFELDAAKGNIPGVQLIHKFGKNSLIATGTVPESIWNGGGLYTGFSDNAERVRVAAGGNLADTLVGSGAQKITIFGLDGSGNVISEVIETNGVNVSAWTTLTFKRMWIARTTQAGAVRSNEGQVTIEQETSGDIMAVMPIGTNRTHIACWTVPSGNTFYMHNFYVTSIGGANVRGHYDIFITNGGNSIFESRQPIVAVEGGGEYVRELDWLAIPENSDIDIRCTESTGNNVVATAGFHGVLIDN